MKIRAFLVIFLALTSISFGQSKKFERLLKKNLKNTVPIVRVSELDTTASYLCFDAREAKEYNTSHLPGAIFVGFDFFDLEQIERAYPDKSEKILVYCSIGVRSELIGEKLVAAGYTNVFNLYGGIFEWKNQSKTVLDTLEQPTDKVHTFSKEWSKWLSNGEKVYEN